MRHIKLYIEFCLEFCHSPFINLYNYTLFSLKSRKSVEWRMKFCGRVCDFVFREEFDERSSLSRCQRGERETPSVPPLILMHSAAFSAYCTRVDDGVQQYRSRVSVSDTLYALCKCLSSLRTNRGRNGTEFCPLYGGSWIFTPTDK